MQAKWRARVRETRNSRRVRGAQSPSSGYSRSSRVSAGLRSWRSGETARTVQAGVVQERFGAPSAVRSWSFPNPGRRRAGSRTPGSRGSGSADLDPPQGYGPGRADKAHLHHLIYRNLRRALREPRRRRVPVGSDGRRPGLRERSPAHKFTKVSLLSDLNNLTDGTGAGRSPTSGRWAEGKLNTEVQIGARSCPSSATTRARAYCSPSRRSRSATCHRAPEPAVQRAWATVPGVEAPYHIWYIPGMKPPGKAIVARFYRSPGGREPVRE